MNMPDYTLRDLMMGANYVKAKKVGVNLVEWWALRGGDLVRYIRYYSSDLLQFEPATGEIFMWFYFAEAQSDEDLRNECYNLMNRFLKPYGISVGQGKSALVRFPNGKEYVANGSYRYTTDVEMEDMPED